MLVTLGSDRRVVSATQVTSAQSFSRLVHVASRCPLCSSLQAVSQPRVRVLRSRVLGSTYLQVHT